MASVTRAVLFVVSATIVAITDSAKLPSTFPQCHQRDPNFDQCLVKAVESAIHQMTVPLPQLGLDTLEPLAINELLIGSGTGSVSVQQNFHNIKLHGLTGSIVLGHKVSLKEHTLWAQSITPMLRLEADYDMTGRILLLPVYGEGLCNVTLFDTHINHTLTGELYEKKGKTYLKYNTYTVTLRPERMEYKFDNLFNGDKRLGDEINKVLNDNWADVFRDVRDGYEKSFGAIFLDLANRVFSRVPLKDIYLE